MAESKPTKAEQPADTNADVPEPDVSELDASEANASEPDVSEQNVPEQGTKLDEQEKAGLKPTSQGKATGQGILPKKASEDDPLRWGDEPGYDHDAWLKEQRPPHWG